jgi:hypothetical protein
MRSPRHDDAGRRVGSLLGRGAVSCCKGSIGRSVLYYSRILRIPVSQTSSAMKSHESKE